VRRRGERLPNRVDRITDLAHYLHLLHYFLGSFILLPDRVRCAAAVRQPHSHLARLRPHRARSFSVSQVLHWDRLPYLQWGRRPSLRLPGVLGVVGGRGPATHSQRVQQSADPAQVRRQPAACIMSCRCIASQCKRRPYRRGPSPPRPGQVPLVYFLSCLHVLLLCEGSHRHGESRRPLVAKPSTRAAARQLFGPVPAKGWITQWLHSLDAQVWLA